MFFEILLEGESDVPTVKSILNQRYGFQQNIDYRIHPHRGKGSLPDNPLARPDLRARGLLDQLPAKLRGYAHLAKGSAVIVLLDADRSDCRQLKLSLIDLYQNLPQKPSKVLFRIAVEEIESWFLADREAIIRSGLRVNAARIPRGEPDQVIGAWERLAEVLNRKPIECNGGDKHDWAEAIAPHLDLDNPRSPSLKAFIDGVDNLVGKLMTEEYESLEA